MLGNNVEGDDNRCSLTSGGIAQPNSPHVAASTVDLPPPHTAQVLQNFLENVLSFLTSNRDRNAASLVCKSWFRIEARTRLELFIGNCYVINPARAIGRFPCIQSLVLKGKPHFSDHYMFPMGWGAQVSPWIASMALSYPALQRVCLKRMIVRDIDLENIATNFSSCQNLTIIRCKGFGTTGLTFIASKLRRLRSLDLIKNDLRDNYENGADWVSCFPPGNTCLESLVFDCVDYAVNLEALVSLVARSPSLWRLKLNYNISVSQLFRLMSCAPQLTHLGTGSFSSFKEEDDCRPSLKLAFMASKCLVDISGFQDFSPRYMSSIYLVCANLITLNLSDSNITTDQFEPVITRCHNLQTLWVRDSVYDNGLHMVAATCKNLRELRVFHLYEDDYKSFITDVGLIAISEGCKKLQSILFSCDTMTNGAVITMSKNCQDLVVFRLCIIGFHRDRLTRKPMDAGFGAIVKNCKKLTRLGVSGLLTDKAFAYIGRYGKLVRTLAVDCVGKCDMGLRYVFEGCPKLQKLEIKGGAFGDTALLSGIHHYYNMRSLVMSSCMISMEGCEEVKRRLPRMVVEVLEDRLMDDNRVEVETLYMYRSLDGRRSDAPSFLKIL